MHSGGEMDTTRANLICDTLAEHFNLNPILILPAILVLLVSVFKLPALLGMGLTVVVSIVFAMVFQGVNFVELTYQVDVEGRTVDEVAREFLVSLGLLEA